MTPRKHRHAELIKRWLDDDSLVVERLLNEVSGWRDDDSGNWYDKYEYRFKPKMIRCGDLEFPEPMRVAPANGAEYWYVYLLGFHRAAEVATWHGGAQEYQTLKHGLIHTTPSAAEAHARALIALTEVK